MYIYMYIDIYICIYIYKYMYINIFMYIGIRILKGENPRMISCSMDKKLVCVDIKSGYYI
jgi:hypothetical protein